MLNVQDIIDRNVDAHVLFKESVNPLQVAPVNLPPEPRPLPKGIDMEKLRKWQIMVARRRAQELKRTAFDSILYFIE